MAIKQFKEKSPDINLRIILWLRGQDLAKCSALKNVFTYLLKASGGAEQSGAILANFVGDKGASLNFARAV